MPLLKFCGCELKTAVLVIALMSFLCEILLLVSCVLLLAYGMSNLEQTDSFSTLSASDKEEKLSASQLPSQIMSALIPLISSILLVLGVYKKHCYFFLPWLVVYLIAVMAFYLVIIAILTICMSVATEVWVIFVCIALLLTCAVIMFFWYAVYSYYVVVRDEQNENLP